MARKLFLLRNVPDDEADEVRALLEEHQIEFHETPAGFFGIGTAAIWINDETEFETARNLLNDYQSHRFSRARETWLENKKRGEQPRFSELFRHNPARVIIYFMVAILLIMLTILPFFL